MTRHVWFLFVVLIPCSITSSMPSKRVVSIGRWANNSIMRFTVKQDCSYTCIDKNEVEWNVDSTDQAQNYVWVVSPNEKILRIENISRYDTGVYKCMSKHDPYRFVKIVFHIFGDRPGTELLGYQFKTFTGHISLDPALDYVEDRVGGSSRWQNFKAGKFLNLFRYFLNLRRKFYDD